MVWILEKNYFSQILFFGTSNSAERLDDFVAAEITRNRNLIAYMRSMDHIPYGGCVLFFCHLDLSKTLIIYKQRNKISSIGDI